jgi:hypothetical protein
MKPTFFPSLSEWRNRLEQHHQTHEELWVGFHKKDSGKPSITWPEAVDAALCFGWIDGVRKSLDEVSYVIRFTPRRPRSIWSAINISRVAELTRLGLMRAAGTQAFEGRTGERSEIYAYEQRRGAKLSGRLRETVPRNRHRGDGSPRLPCHATVHPGPHTAVRRIQLGPYDHGWKPERSEVGIGQGKGQSGRVREPPGAVRTAGSFRRQDLTDPSFAKLAEPCSSALPLLPHHRPKSAA